MVSPERGLPPDMDPRIRVQVEAAFAWTDMEQAEHLDLDQLILAWTKFFAALARRLFNAGVTPEQFLARFVVFEQEVVQAIEELKLFASQQAHRDVGIEGASELVYYSLSQLRDAERRLVGILLELKFPHIDEPGRVTTKQLLFPVGEELDASSFIASIPIVQEPCSTSFVPRMIA